MKSNQASIKAVLLLSLGMTLLWAIFDMGGHLSRSVGLTPRTPLHLIWGMDLLIWTLCFFLLGKQSEMRMWNAVAVGTILIFVPALVVSLLDPEARMTLASYDSTVNLATVAVGIFATLLALVFDWMVNQVETFQAQVEASKR